MTRGPGRHSERNFLLFIIIIIIAQGRTMLQMR